MKHAASIHKSASKSKYVFVHLKCLSMLTLKQFRESEFTTESGSEFQCLTTRLQNEKRLVSSLHLSTKSFSELPLVRKSAFLGRLGTVDCSYRLRKILYTCIMSPLSLRYFSVGNCKCISLCL